METALNIKLIIAVAALLLTVVAYAFSPQDFFKKYEYARAAIGSLLLLAAISVTLIYS